MNKNPDYTFWTRLLAHCNDTHANDFAGHEELEYLKYVAKQQLRQQYENATGEEWVYLESLKTKEKIS